MRFTRIFTCLSYYRWALGACGATVLHFAPLQAAVAMEPEIQADQRSHRSAAPMMKEAESEVLILMVDKQNLRARLMTWPKDLGHSKVLSSFKIAVGKEVGDKQKEGDNRTPEGIYFTESVIDGAKLPAKYGPKAIPINFPNPVDRKFKKSGYGIWLHGVEDNSRVEEAKVTEGCVAFYNEDILALSDWLEPHQAVVVIAEDAKQVNRLEDIKDVYRSSIAWMTAWQQRDLDAYVDHYHELFRFRNRGHKGFRSYKERVFNKYRQMRVEMSEVRVMVHPKYAVSLMNQDFNGDDSYITSGRKILYWQKNDQGQWQIIDETFENRRVEPFHILPDALAELTRLERLPKSTRLRPPEDSSSSL